MVNWFQVQSKLQFYLIDFASFVLYGSVKGIETHYSSGDYLIFYDQELCLPLSIKTILLLKKQIKNLIPEQYQGIFLNVIWVMASKLSSRITSQV